MSSSGGIPYIGSKISLISKAEIRYEGILYDVNTKDSTVTLSKVRSHGTEGRPAQKIIQPRQEVYEYIIFRGSDIKDLCVDEVSKPHPPPAEEPEDPAILSTTSVAPPTSRANTTPQGAPQGGGMLPTPPGLPQQPLPPHSLPLPMYNQFPMGAGATTSGLGNYNPFGLPYFNRPPLLINQPQQQQQSVNKQQQSAPPPPPPAPQRISSSSQQVTPPTDHVTSHTSPLSKAQPSQETSPPISTVAGIETSTPNTSISPKEQDKSPVNTTAVTTPVSSSWEVGGASQTSKEAESRRVNHTHYKQDESKEESHNYKRRNGPPHHHQQHHHYNRGNHHYRGNYRNTPRDSTHHNQRPSSSTNERHMPHPPNSANTKQALRYDVDFDFDSANALFSKESLEKEIKHQLKITDDSTPPTDELPRPLEGTESLEEITSEEGEEPLEAYNKMVSFFDNISCEANSSNKRHTRNEERALNTETFGVTSRGYRGGNKPRGRGGRGGRGYYSGGSDRRYHDNNYRQDGYQSSGSYRGNRSRGYSGGRGRGHHYGNSYNRRGDYHNRDY